ncbi:hypothetical protein ACVIJW_010699 [Bradyrhizobium barranii subsp. barranii]
MVSTYFSYSYITRNLKQSLARVEQQTDVAREEAYYKANIGKVKTVDDFMKDYRLYHYAMKAYGLEDMAYAKAFMKKVLESDLSDQGVSSTSWSTSVTRSLPRHSPSMAVRRRLRNRRTRSMR